MCGRFQQWMRTIPGPTPASLFVVIAACTAAQPDASEIPTENPSSTPSLLTVAGEHMFFTADDGIHGREIWQWSPDPRGDPRNPGQVRLTEDFCPGPASSDPACLFSADGQFYVTARPSAGGPQQFLCWNEAERHFEAIIDVASNRPVLDADPDVAIDGVLYFNACFTPGRRTLGTLPLGGRMAENAMPEMRVIPDRFVVLADGSYVFGGPYGLMITRGTPGNASPLLEGSEPQFILPLGHRVFFAPDSVEYGMEPWVTDGTREGTRLLKDIYPGPTSSTFGQLCTYRDEVYFNPDDGVRGSELWKTDGTPEGTMLLKEILPGAAGSDAHYFCPASGALYFVASDLEHGKELWKTDGTPEGTLLAADLHPGAQGTEIWSLAEFNGVLYFCGSTSDSGEELFRTSGDADGAVLVRDIVPGPRHSGPANLTVAGEWLFFTCNDALHGEELWQTDGTMEGTRLVGDIALPRYNPSSSPHDLRALPGKVCFSVNDILHGEELWASDGTADGTALLADIAPGPAGSNPAHMVVWNSALFFAASAPDTGRELWRSDGTAAGTAVFADILPGPESATPESLSVVEDRLYFTANDGIHGMELWCTDGSSGGTRLVRNIVDGGGSAKMSPVFHAGNLTCFYVLEDMTTAALWHTQGGEENTSRLLTIRDLFSSADLDFAAAAAHPQSAQQPVPGAMMPELIPVVRPVAGQAAAGGGVVMGGNTYFVARTAPHGAEIWVTDGTWPGTRLLCDAYPGVPSSSPGMLTVLGNTLYFVAETPLEGRVLWRSSAAPGTAKTVTFQRGYVRLGAVAPDVVLRYEDKLLISCASRVNPSTDRAHLALISEAGDQNDYSDLYVLENDTDRFRFKEITVCGRSIFFTYDDRVHGEELWVSNGAIERLNPGSTHLVKDILPYGDLTPLNR